jgi:hypothetical protein
MINGRGVAVIVAVIVVLIVLGLIAQGLWG